VPQPRRHRQSPPHEREVVVARAPAPADEPLAAVARPVRRDAR
jgi:hypothetical protein